MVTDKSFAKLVIKGKIESYLNTGVYSSFNDFFNNNANLEDFINNSNLSIVLSHSNDYISNDEYLEILESMKIKYSTISTTIESTNVLDQSNNLESTTLEPANVLDQSNNLESTTLEPTNILDQNDNLEDTIVLPFVQQENNELNNKQSYQATKIENLKNGFIDAAILAFVTGSIFGALFINLYINILRTLS